MEDMNLIDIWRTRNPNDLKFTRRERSQGGLVQARLDFWLVSEQTYFQIKKYDIKPGMKSDHSLVRLTLDLGGAVIGNLIILFLKTQNMLK